MKKDLFVAGLDFSLNSDDLKAIFEEHGVVISAKVITDKFSGQSRGFGFVEMSTQEEAQQCIRNLDGTSRNNRNLAVKFKEDKPTNNARSGYNSRW
jgi:RNA recognition motif-containing protein